MQVAALTVKDANQVARKRCLHSSSLMVMVSDKRLGTAREIIYRRYL